MKILVCVKQVPDTNEVKIDPVKGTLIRDGVPSILNPDDANALEAALMLKDKDPDVEIAVLTMVKRPGLWRRGYLRHFYYHCGGYPQS